MRRHEAVVSLLQSIQYSSLVIVHIFVGSKKAAFAIYRFSTFP